MENIHVLFAYTHDKNSAVIGLFAGLTKSPSIGSIGKELALSEFINKYAKSLPQRVRVCKGFYGVSDQTAVTTGDILNMHYLKTTKVSVKCSLLYYKL